MKNILIKIFVPVLFILFVNRVSAAELESPIPPNNTIKCNEVSSEEFHSLRPYQKNIQCTSNTEEYANYCGGDLTLEDNIEVRYPESNGECTTSGDKINCTYNIHVSKTVVINLSGAELPIMGNTEDVVNSKNDTDSINDAIKMNEYVSWYLGGVTNKKEYPDKNDGVSIINFSGPLAKLLPQEIQFLERFKQIQNAKKTRHDQMVVCTKKEIDSSVIPGVFKWALEKLGIGQTVATDCDNGETMRITDWDGNLSIFRDIQNAGVSLVDLFVKAIPFVGQSIIEDSINNNKAWPYRTPPLMSSVDPNGESFNTLTYQKAYNEWRGKSCIIIPFSKFLVCLEDYLVPNKFADMYSYIPMSSTEDTKGEIVIDNKPTSTGTTGTTQLTNVSFTKLSGTGKASSTLFFPHMEETDDLSSILQDTYVPKGLDKTVSPTNISSEASCIDVEVRSNAGDNLFASQINGTLNYDASFSCTFSPIVTTTNQACLQKCVFRAMDPNTCKKQCQETTPPQTCTKTLYIKLSTSSNTPKVDDIWSRLVAGSMSVFKRIFPKTNTDGSVGQIIDIAGSTGITYSGTSIEGKTTDLKIPHIGGISEYFLKGIQTALRPKGYGEPISFAKISKSNVPYGVCDGEVFKKYSPPSETSNKANDYFNLHIANSLSSDLVAIYKEAERQTGVPCEVLAGIHFEEASNDPNFDLQSGAPLNSRSLIESAVQAGHELAAKVGGTISTWNDMITAVSYYNGGGNRNCGRGLSYTGPCPPPSGIDDPYATAFIDSKHDPMYLIYCWDHTLCPTPRLIARPGVLTVAIELYNSD